jgi:para-nitrobenzyl esterase
VRRSTADGTPVPRKSGKEDCLYLNVNTPDLAPKQLKPVMVWIHGGANAGGSTDELSSGKSLCNHGVVIVTVQYRLGLLGFMAHPELTKESIHHSSGNYGLFDQLAVLK